MSEFHRITVENWQHILGIVSLMLFFCTFVLTVIRAVGMSRGNLRHVETLPLEEEGHE